MLVAHTQPILYMTHATNGFSNVFRAALRIFIRYGTGECHFAVGYFYLDLRSIYPWVIAQTVIDVFFDPGVGALVAFGAHALVAPLVMRPFAEAVFPQAAVGIIIAKPAPYLIAGTVEPVAVIAFPALFLRRIVPAGVAAVFAAGISPGPASFPAVAWSAKFIAIFFSFLSAAEMSVFATEVGTKASPVIRIIAAYAQVVGLSR